MERKSHHEFIKVHLDKFKQILSSKKNIKKHPLSFK